MASSFFKQLYPNLCLWKMDGLWFLLNLTLHILNAKLDLFQVDWAINQLLLLKSAFWYRWVSSKCPRALSFYFCYRMVLNHLASHIKLLQVTTNPHSYHALNFWWSLELNTQEFHKTYKWSFQIRESILKDQSQSAWCDLNHREVYSLVLSHGKWSHVNEVLQDQVRFQRCKIKPSSH